MMNTYTVRVPRTVYVFIRPLGCMQGLHLGIYQDEEHRDLLGFTLCASRDTSNV